VTRQTVDPFDDETEADEDAGFFELDDAPIEQDLEVLVQRASGSTRNELLSALSAFQRNADRFPPLNPEQQLEVARSYRAAVDARLELSTTRVRGRRKDQLEQLAARETGHMEHLCASCWKLAWLIVREQSEERFGRDRAAEMLPDLMAEANAALVAAVRDFDPTRTPKFGTYAARVIRDHIRAVLSKEGYVRLAPSWNRVKRIAAARIPEMVSELGRSPSIPELQADLLKRCMDWANRKLTDDQRLLPAAQQHALCMAKLRKQGMLGAIRDIEEVLQAAQSVVSLDQPVGDQESGATLGDLVVAPHDGGLYDRVELDELRGALLTALGALSDREKEIVLLRYGFDGSEGWTYAAIAERYGVTPERIRQIERAALSKLSSPGGQFSGLGDFLPRHA
jgi:RNA polymerase sigma factor (sigma-70 family)